MSSADPRWQRWLVVVLFAVAMAYVEAAAVVYIRQAIGRIDPHQLGPLEMPGWLARTELVRELATLIMLATVGTLAGRTLWARFGFAIVAFGVWDIFYYLFLWPLCGWPDSLWDWDILFLIPLPWWGPVLSPVLIALLLVIGGTLMIKSESYTHVRPTRLGWWLAAPGAVIALGVFMADALRIVSNGGGRKELEQLVPTEFNWPLFLVGYALMCGSVWDVWRQFPVAERAAASSRTPNQC
jgi:hypothetical protein